MTRYRAPIAADGPALDAMARRTWVETFGHSASAENIARYLAEAYGPDGKLMRDLADPAMTFRVACDGDTIVAYAKLSAPFVGGAPAHDALQLNQLYVAASHQGRGVADALVDWAIETAHARGNGAVVLTVWEGNHRARRFYERRGFAHVGYYDFLTGDQVDRDLVVRLAL